MLTNHNGNPIQLRRFYIFLRKTVKDEEIIKEVSSQILSRSHIFKKCYRTNGQGNDEQTLKSKT